MLNIYTKYIYIYIYITPCSGNADQAWLIECSPLPLPWREPLHPHFDHKGRSTKGNTPATACGSRASLRRNIRPTPALSDPPMGRRRRIMRGDKWQGTNSKSLQILRWRATEVGVSMVDRGVCWSLFQAALTGPCVRTLDNGLHVRQKIASHVSH